MSGEQTVYFAGAPFGAMVVAAQRLAEAGLPSYAVIGGLAVNARLGGAHRATADLDAVVDDDLVPTALEILAGLDDVVVDANKPWPLTVLDYYRGIVDSRCHGEH